jgi:hypothetical protein
VVVTPDLERDLAHAVRVQVLMLLVIVTLGAMTGYLQSQLEMHKARLKAGCSFCAQMRGAR